MHMEQVWGVISALCMTLSEREWKTPTDYPSCTAQDRVAHILGSESRLLSFPHRSLYLQDTGHVKNESLHRALFVARAKPA